MKKLVMLVFVMSCFLFSGVFALDTLWYEYGYKMQAIDSQYKMLKIIGENFDDLSEGDNSEYLIKAVFILLADIKDSGKELNTFVRDNQYKMKQVVSNGYYVNLLESTKKFDDMIIDNFPDIINNYNKYSDNLTDEFEDESNERELAYSILLGSSVSSIINRDGYICDQDATFNAKVWEDGLVGVGSKFLSDSQYSKLKVVSSSVLDYKRLDSEINEAKLVRTAKELHNLLLNSI